MEEQIVINNQLISFLKTGNAGNKCLLFLHGWRSSKEIWENIVYQVIKLSGYKVYALDLPGFGQSPAPKNPQPPLSTSFEGHLLPEGEGGWGVGDYANLVGEFIEKLGLKNVVVIGHSFGGRVAIKLVANPHPASGHPLPEGEGRVRGLVLVDSAGFAEQTPKKNLMRIAAKIAKPFFQPKFMQSLRKKIYQKIGVEDYLATPQLRQTFVNVIREDLTEDLKRIKIPTLIIWGEKDIETPVSFGRKMYGLIPAKGGTASGGHNSKFLILPNAGHFSFLDQPEEFVEELIKFLRN